MEKMVRSFSKRLVACLLCMALVVTYTVPASAVIGDKHGTSGEEWTTEIVSPGQTIYYNAEGKEVKPDANGKIGPWNVKTESIAEEADEVDTYNVTLKVTTKGDIKENEVKADSATVIALDMSGSMNDRDGKNIPAVKSGAKAFLDNYANNAGDCKRMVAIVEFGNEARTITHFVDVNTEEGMRAAKAAIDAAKVGFPYVPGKLDNFCEVQYFGLKGQKDGTKVTNKELGKYALKADSWWTCEHSGCEDGRYSGKTKHYVTDIENGIWDEGVYGRFHSHDGGGTNMEGGMMLARNLINTGKATDGDIEGIANTNVIVFTDGAPTTHPAVDDKTATDLILCEADAIVSANGGRNGSVNANDYDDIPALATEIKADSALYFITYRINEDADNKKKVNGQKISDWIKNTVAVTGHYNDANAKELKKSFENITKKINETLGVSKVVVTNPMGDMIQYKSGIIADVGTAVDEETARLTMTWRPSKGTAVNNEPAPGPKPQDETLYTVTYKVKVDTALKGFVDNEIYPAGDPVTVGFKYGPKAEEKEVPFGMPTFKGVVPVRPYAIQYYKMNKETKEYDLVEKDVETFDAQKLNTPISLLNAENKLDAKYEYKYAADNYRLATELPEGKENRAYLEISKDKANVLTLYYEPIPAYVTVNYHYTTITKGPDSATEVSDEGKDAEGNPIIESYDRSGYVGDSYTATKDIYTKEGVDGRFNKKDGVEYKLVRGNDTIEALKENKADNVIDLYFEGVKDLRKDATYLVQKRFDDGYYKLEEKDGEAKYVTAYAIGALQKVSEGSKKAYDPITVALADENKEGYTYHGYENNTGDVTVNDGIAEMELQEGANTLTVIYRKAPEETRTPAVINVVHHYYLDETVIENGGRKNTKKDFTTTTAITDVYVNETFTPVEDCVYGGKTYVPRKGNEKELVPTKAEAGTNEVHLYYDLKVTPKETTAVVKHVYVHNTKKVDEDNNIYIDTNTTSVAVDYPAKGEVLYVGESFTSDFLGRKNYTADITTVPSITLDEDAAKNIITITYTWNEEGRAKGNITVKHVYIDHNTRVEGGRVKVVDLKDTADFVKVRDFIEGYAGETYTIVPVTEFGNHKDYELKKTQRIVAIDEDGQATYEDAQLSGKFHAGTNSTIVLTYERSSKSLKTGVLNILFKLVDKEGYINSQNKYAYRYVEPAAADGTRHYADEMVAHYTITPKGIKVTRLSETDEEGIFEGEEYQLDLPKTYEHEGTTYKYLAGSDIVVAEAAEEETTENAAADSAEATTVNAANRMLRAAAPEDPEVTAAKGLGGIVYGHIQELPHNSINVVKNFKTTTIDKVGKSSEATTSSATVIEDVYQGQYIPVSTTEPGFAFKAEQTTVTDNATATAATEAGKLNVTLTDASAQAVVNLFYERTEDNSVTAGGIVTHHYIEQDWDGKRSEVNTVSGEADVIKSFATLEYTATKHVNVDYKFEKAEPSLTITLKPGNENNIDLYYVKKIDTRLDKATKLTVYHNYYMQDTSGFIAENNGRWLVNSIVQPISTTEGAWIGNKFTASPKTKYTEWDGADITDLDTLRDWIFAAIDDQGTKREYQILTPSGEYTNVDVVAVADNKDGQIITIDYYCNYNARSEQSVRVQHIYWASANHAEGAEPDYEESFVYNYGDTTGGTWSDEGSFFTANEKSRSGYKRVTATEKLTIDYSDPMAAEIGVVIEYVKKSGKKPGGRTDDDPPAPKDITDDDVPLADLPDDEVPLSDLPGGIEEEEIPEDEVPLADLPLTGGIGVGLFILAGGAMAAAGFGLRRREEEK